MPRSKKKNRKQAEEAQPPAPASWKGRLTLVGSLMGASLLVFAWLDFRSVSDQETAMTKQLAQWKATYELNDEQVHAIRDIEIRFHGTGHLLTRPGRTFQDQVNHHNEIAHIMGDDAGRAFLQKNEPQLFK